MADDELDELFRVKPEEFAATRTRLAGAAKQRGDAATAKRISASRKPTTAAWIVNLLALRNTDARQALTDLGERLRAAHATMDGDRIRALSAEQRKLVDELGRAAFDAAGLTDPPAGLRDDVTGTLQAAIADPDVAARLGRLTKAERWTGFGGFGDTAPVFTDSRRGKATAEPRARRSPQEISRATTTSRPPASNGRRRALRWPRQGGPRPRPTMRCPSDRPNARRPGCVVTMRANASRRLNANSTPPRAPMRRPSRPAATPRNW